MNNLNRKRKNDSDSRKETALDDECSINLNKNGYCICKKQLGGEMVQCSRNKCEVKWYHLHCINMRIVPRGKWTCLQCQREIRLKKFKKDGNETFNILPEAVVDCSDLPDPTIDSSDIKRVFEFEKELRIQIRAFGDGDRIKTVEHLLKLAKSNIHGRGVFAIKAIEKGVRIAEYTGEIISKDESDEREKRYKEKGTVAIYLFAVDKDSVIDATLEGNIARFINHSCFPNVYAKIQEIEGVKRMFFYAKRRIPAGFELSVDYKFDFDADQPRIKCQCNKVSCFGYLDV